MLKLENISQGLDRIFNYVDRITEYKDRPIESKDYWKGVLYGAYKMLSYMVDELDISTVIQKDLTDEQKKQYIYKETFIADEFTVSLNNNVYRQMNPEIPEIVEGQEITTEIEPWGLITFGDNVYPIYSDDAGQCDVILIDGELIGAGAYNFTPEYDFVEDIIGRLVDKKVKELEEKLK